MSLQLNDAGVFHSSICPACGYSASQTLLEDTQPLATLGWSKSANEARAMKQLPLNYVRCVDCGHIYNLSFDYGDVPYYDHPNLMFNKGALWSSFIQGIRSKLAALLPHNPTIVEIGYGDGSFLSALTQVIDNGKFIGFDPHGAKLESDDIQIFARLFMPMSDLASLKPDLIVSRHVLEHLTNPLEFLQSLTLASTLSEHGTMAYFEVPCVDRLIETGRTVDLYYEHGSQFTSRSFSRMLDKAGVQTKETGHGYDREVIWGIVNITPQVRHQETIADSTVYRHKTEQALSAIKIQLSDILGSGKTIGIWGGTGKSAAFINRYALDAKRFPIVVDSDNEKVGFHVPGTGQEILFRDALKANPVDIIIIPPQWRAKDISLEITREGIQYEKILIEHDGRLVDFNNDDHPYIAKSSK
ncbi:MAG: class I SAM-dependent methyltransferase [Rhodospirillaceae bacterium]